MPKPAARKYYGVDEQLSDDWAEYWENEAMQLEELAERKKLLLARTNQSDRVMSLLVSNVRFSVHKPKIIKDLAERAYMRRFDRMPPIIETVVPMVPEHTDRKIDYKQIRHELGLNCPLTQIEYKGTKPK